MSSEPTKWAAAARRALRQSQNVAEEAFSDEEYAWPTSLVAITARDENGNGKRVRGVCPAAFYYLAIGVPSRITRLSDLSLYFDEEMWRSH